MKLCPKCSNLVLRQEFLCDECGFAFPRTIAPSDPKATAITLHKLLGSFLSALVGWFLPTFGALGYSFITRKPPDTGFGATDFLLLLLVVFLVPLLFVLAVWIVLLVPLYFYVPRRSPLWRWPVCTLCGAFAGAVIAAPLFWNFNVEHGPVLMAAIIGGVTCLFGSLTREFYHRDDPSWKD